MLAKIEAAVEPNGATDYVRRESVALVCIYTSTLEGDEHENRGQTTFQPQINVVFALLPTGELVANYAAACINLNTMGDCGVPTIMSSPNFRAHLPPV